MSFDVDIVKAWIADDPDATTAAEVQALLDAALAGDTAAEADLADRFAGVLDWIADDPDATTAAEVQALLDAALAGDAAAEADLADRFAGVLEFGTAGLRGHLGGGPNRMNRAVVIKAAAGLMAVLRERVGEGFSVVHEPRRRH